ncbi:kelch-like protein 6 isoform X4 [Anneissia japonica]|uniref:kelch-like protein 6 isoform X3 n=1 Tax=Anneissia japonica TaxID=1529436 RepID=UPI001425ADE0|nr:kelch-like protein 6 isoform X3 [Anneissia japonica]XP_033125739.1 kelch-like protein 6 isoform X4 [Anneissia japonica]
MEIISPEECYFDDSSERDQTILQSLHYARSENVLTDVILCADDRQIPCHRIVLAVSSDYFMAMFSSSFKESKMTKIDLTHLKGKSLTILVNYFYSSVLKFPKSMVRDILETSDLIQLSPVVEHCTDVILKDMQIEECLDIFQYADDRVSLKDLKAGALKMIWEQFHFVKDMDEYLDLTADCLMDIISSSCLISREEDVFDSVITWFNHDSSRRDDLLRIIENIRFNLMSGEYLELIESFLTNDLNITLTSIKHAKEFHSCSSTKKHQLLTNKMKERRCHQDVVVFYKMMPESVGNSKSEMTFATPEVFREIVQQGEYDEEVVEFAQVTLTQDPLLRISEDVKAITQFGSSVFVCTATSVEVIDPRTGVRSFVEITLPEYTEWHPLTAATLEGLVYVIQGNNIGRANSVVCFDKWRKVWDKCASFNIEVSSPTLVAYDGEMFLFGTNNSGTIVQSYDPCIDKWHQGNSLTGCHCFSGGSVLVPADEEELPSICVTCPDHIHTYNPHSDVWQTIDSWAQLATCEELSGPLMHCVPVSCNGNCFLYFDDTPPDSQGSHLAVLRLSPYTGNWTTCQFEYESQEVREEGEQERHEVGYQLKTSEKRHMLPPPVGHFEILKCITICRK